LFDAGRAAHPNVWLLVAAGERGSFPAPLHLLLRAQESVWRRWEGRPRPDLRDPEFGTRRPVMMRRRETPAASPPPDRPPRREETARLFGSVVDMEEFVAAAESAGAVLDPGAEFPPVSPSLAGTAPSSTPFARWISRVYATLKQHRPTQIQRTPPTPDGIELYVLDLDPWEASLLAIRLLTGQAAAAPGAGGAEPAAAEAAPPAQSSPDTAGERADGPTSDDHIDPAKPQAQRLAAAALAAEAAAAPPPADVSAEARTPPPSAGKGKGRRRLYGAAAGLLRSAADGPRKGAALAGAVGVSPGYARQLLAEMVKKGLLGNGDDGYFVTKKGRRALERLT
jgi:hypothetical protein